MVEYNPRIIQVYADKLYTQANITVIINFIIGLVFGVIICYILERFLSSIVIEAVFILFTTAIGYFKGQEKAFSFRLQAQMALCQAKIEEHTKKSVAN
ncbi:MAG: hypothetical protein GXY14_11460 [Spirochaetes bacterium]|nr:hypothetical protein [Spirochaetota bacterium]